MAYPDILYTVCCVAEVESDVEGDCPNCKGTQMQYHVFYEADEEGFEAKVKISGANLQSYHFDSDKPTPASAEYSETGKFFIAYTKQFKHLCLKYNREGDPRLNVVAVNTSTGKKIRPTNILQSDGTDIAWPIESATVTLPDGTINKFDLTRFTWEDGQPTVIHDPDAGAWTVAPQQNELRYMELKALDHLALASENGLPLRFVSWERNRLSNWFKGETPQWTGKGEIIKFDDDILYYGIVLYYEPQNDSIVHIPDTKPGPETKGYPAPGRQIRSALLWVWNQIIDFLRVVFRFRR